MFVSFQTARATKRRIQNFTETVVNGGRAKRSSSRQVQGVLDLH